MTRYGALSSNYINETWKPTEGFVAVDTKKQPKIYSTV